MSSDPSFTMVLFILPSLFGLTLIGEGVNKVMNYDNHGWINLSLGGIFLVLLIFGYLMFAGQVSL